MTLTTALLIWVIGMPIALVLNVLWFRLRGKRPTQADGIMAMMYSFLWPGAYPLYWFMLLYFWVIGRLCAGACWVWNKIAIAP